jgi:peptidoglycan-associated lipoprotein
MKLKTYKHGLAVILASTLVVGCESLQEDVSSDTSVQASAGSNAGATIADNFDKQKKAEREAAKREAEMREKQLAEERAAAAAAAAAAAEEAKMKKMAALRDMTTFYFDLDDASIADDAREALMAHAAFLSANAGMKVVVEGHTDERGTNAYNMALGEERGAAVAQFLKVNGVSDSQVEVVSYGEEQPAMAGSDESAWAKNRRAVVQYQ